MFYIDIEGVLIIVKDKKDLLCVQWIYGKISLYNDSHCTTKRLAWRQTYVNFFRHRSIITGRFGMLH